MSFSFEILEAIDSVASTGELEGYDRIASRLRPGFGGGGNWVREFLLTATSEDGSSGGPLPRAGTVLSIHCALDTVNTSS